MGRDEIRVEKEGKEGGRKGQGAEERSIVKMRS